jgi:peptide/nickel transport system substrate-binding protein
MMDEYQFSFWFETLWVLDWSLNDPQTFNFEGGETPVKYIGGQLAESWDFDPDSGVLAVNLRKGVKFHQGEPYNGRELTSDDVVWSYSRLLGMNGIPKTDSEIDWAQYLTMLDGVAATDGYTVEFALKEGLRNEIALGQLMNAKVNIAGREWEDSAKDWTCAKGTGPYVLEEYVPDNSMKFVRNEEYYGFDERYPENKLPYIDVINLVYIADSSNILSSPSNAIPWLTLTFTHWRPTI